MKQNSYIPWWLFSSFGSIQQLFHKTFSRCLISPPWNFFCLCFDLMLNFYWDWLVRCFPAQKASHFLALVSSTFLESICITQRLTLLSHKKPQGCLLPHPPSLPPAISWITVMCAPYFLPRLPYNNFRFSISHPSQDPWRYDTSDSGVLFLHPLTLYPNISLNVLSLPHLTMKRHFYIPVLQMEE